MASSPGLPDENTKSTEKEPVALTTSCGSDPKTTGDVENALPVARVANVPSIPTNKGEMSLD